jgi:hypothetical protein
LERHFLYVDKGGRRIRFSTVVSVLERSFICSNVQSGKSNARLADCLRASSPPPGRSVSLTFDFFVGNPCITAKYMGLHGSIALQKLANVGPPLQPAAGPNWVAAGMRSVVEAGNGN